MTSVRTGLLITSLSTSSLCLIAVLSTHLAFIEYLLRDWRNRWVNLWVYCEWVTLGLPPLSFTPSFGHHHHLLLLSSVASPRFCHSYHYLISTRHCQHPLSHIRNLKVIPLLLCLLSPTGPHTYGKLWSLTWLKLFHLPCKNGWALSNNAKYNNSSQNVLRIHNVLLVTRLNFYLHAAA